MLLMIRKMRTCNGTEIYKIEQDDAMPPIVPIGHSHKQRRGCQNRCGQRQDYTAQDGPIGCAVYDSRFHHLNRQAVEIIAQDKHPPGIHQHRDDERPNIVVETHGHGM